jgi:hypothetical protein
MPRHRAILARSLLLGGLLLATSIFIWNRRLGADRQQRESHFIAIHFLAAEATQEGEDGPKNYEELVSLWSGPNSPLGKPFPDGLVYKPHGSSFTLEEPQARWISLLRKDRLVGSERKWPRWEPSGDYAKKMASSKVPPKGYE